MPKIASFLLLILLLSFLASLLVGAAHVGVPEAIRGLFAADDSSLALIMREIRLPRALLAVLVGGALGLGGAALQAYLRNPLADPGLLGVSSGAALGAVLAFYTGFSLQFALALPLLGMAGALLAVLLVSLLAGRSGSANSLILAGIAVSSFAGAAVAVALNLSPNPFAVMEIVFWLMGSLADRTMAHVWLVLPFVLTGALLVLSCIRALAALALGEEVARSLGFSLLGVQSRLLLGVALMVGASVSVSGSIGFVGLMVPHLLRPRVGHSPGRLLVLSALGGAILLLVSDIAVRLIPTSGTELKLGVVTALVGAPFFVLLLMKQRGREA